MLGMCAREHRAKITCLDGKADLLRECYINIWWQVQKQHKERHTGWRVMEVKGVGGKGKTYFKIDQYTPRIVNEKGGAKF